MAAAWAEAVETAPNGKVTAAHVAEVVERYVEPDPVVDRGPEDDDPAFARDAADFDRMCRDWDVVLADFQAVRRSFGNSLHPEDMTTAELRDLRSRIGRIAELAAALAAERDRIGERKIKRGGGPMPRRIGIGGAGREREEETQDEKILRVIRSVGPSTSLDLSPLTEIPVYVLSGRLSELAKVGKILRTGEKRGTAIVYALAEEGR